MMLIAETKIQYQLSTAVAHIARADWPYRWENFLKVFSVLQRFFFLSCRSWFRNLLRTIGPSFVERST